MRTASPLTAAACLVAATPAFATGTIHCTVPGRAGPEVYVSVGNSSGDIQARIVDGRQEVVTGATARSPRLTADYVDPRRLRFAIRGLDGALIARLDTRRGRGAAYLGTLLHRGRTWRIRCLWDEDE